jgi:hypothetical protein
MVAVPARGVSAFRACGWIGLAAASAVALAASSARDLSLAIEALLIGAAVVIFLALAVLTKAIRGRETLIYYHHEIAVLIGVACLAWLLGAPVLGHLDATALGLGAFLACGRVGCLLAGCCHGRPARRGVVYGAAHARAGLPGYLVGRRLVPVQAVEAGAVAALVLVGLLAVSTTPGEALGLYVTGYALVRFGLEELRGDPWRAYWHGLSEAQWTSLAVCAVMTVAAGLGALPGLAAHAGATVVLVMAGVALARRGTRDLLSPRHVRELASVLPEPAPGAPAVVVTSAGLRVSAGSTAGVRHYTISRPGTSFDRAQAERVAAIIGWLRRSSGQLRLVDGVAGTAHLLEES